MTTENRLAKSDQPRQVRRSAQEWVDRGNRILAGVEPMSGKGNEGEYMRRDDIHWFLQDGRVCIGWVR